MGRLTSELVAKLVDQVSGPAAKVASALKAAERQTRAITAATAAGLGNRFTADLVRIGASASTIDKVTAAWTRYRASAGLAADSTKWTKAQIAQVKAWERSHLAALKNVTAAKATMASASRAPAAAVGGSSAFALPMAPGVLAPAAVAAAGVTGVKKFAEAERAITRIGVTAGATENDLKAVGETAFGIAQQVAMPYAKVVEGLNVLVSQGRTLKEAMAFLPAVSRTASAAGAEIDDIAKTADSVGSNFKIAGDQMQAAFDIMAAGGKAGQFELKDMARYLPSLGPAAAAVGFEGKKGLTELVSMLQVLRKGSGSSEEAAGSMANILQKMQSEETSKRFKKFGIDLEAGLKKGKAEGRNLVEVFEDLTRTALKGDLSKLPQLINDMEFARGVRALMTYRGEWQKTVGLINRTSAGSVDADLARVTANTQAKIDRLFNSVEKRARQLGSVLSDIWVPFDKKVEELAGKAAPEVTKGLDVVRQKLLDGYARAEEGQGARYALDPAERKQVDARKELLRRQAYEDRIADFDRRIAEKDAELKALEPRIKGAGAGRASAIIGGRQAAVDQLRKEREGLVALQREVDEAQVKLAEAQGRKNRTGSAMAPGAVQPAPQPITPGISAFGFGRFGAAKSLPPSPASPAPPPSQSPKVMPALPPAPTPKAAPATPPVPAAPMLDRFEQIFSGGVTLSPTSVAAIKEPSGTQDVRVTNPPPAPNINVSVTVNATTGASAADIGSQVGAQVGAAAKRAIQSSYGGGGD